MLHSRSIARLVRAIIPAIILAASGYAYIVLSVEPEETKGKKAAPRKIRTTVTKLAACDYTVAVRTNALVQPQNLVTIRAEVAGRVVVINPKFEVGAFFSKGDVLVELDEDDVTQQQINYENALANKIIAESEVNVAKTGIEEYLEGRFRSELATQTKELVVAETNLKTAKNLYEHARRLYRKGYIGSLAIAAKADAVKHSELDVEAKKAELEVLQNITKAKTVQQLQAALRAAEARLAAEEAALKLEKQKLEREQLRAPFDGRVLSKQVGLGQQVSPQTVLGEVISVDYAEVRLPLARRDLRYLKLPELKGDEPVAVELRDAIDETAEGVWIAKIVRTEGMLDPDSLELFAIALIEDPFGLHSHHPVLRMGQPVVATIKGNQLNDVFKLPRGAVSQLNQVCIINEDTLTLSQRTIEPLWSDDEYIIVRDPAIQDGNLLATTQLVYAPEGSSVEIIPDAEFDDTLAAKAVLVK